ncbi:MAG: 7-carboxy-7-deazaguanine synthase QueE [Hymenobacteraceae bacterium]|nr:7-carboxy-7-deazaguanine synthase QueE [Hymenobacteraceae bacterium]
MIQTSAAPRFSIAQVPPDGLSLPLMEHFYTLQGEGANAGRAAYFVRLGGCDVGCHWCDVKESWSAEDHPLTAIGALVALAAPYAPVPVVVTGGEPALYNLGPLTQALAAAGLPRWIETSGAYALSGEWEWVCLSPKKFKPPHASVYARTHELKVVVFHESDLAWAEEHAARVGPACRLFLQPEWSRAARVLPRLVEYVKLNPRWQLSLQTHKYLDIP